MLHANRCRKLRRLSAVQSTSNPRRCIRKSAFDHSAEEHFTKHLCAARTSHGKPFSTSNRATSFSATSWRGKALLLWRSQRTPASSAHIVSFPVFRNQRRPHRNFFASGF